MPAAPTIVRELGRRRIRSGLTAAGIAIGVAALVLLGSLAEKMGRLVDGGRDFAMGQITVSGAGSGGAPGGMLRGALLSGEQLAALPKVDGVKAVAPIVIFPASDGPPPLPFTLSPMVFGVDLVLLWQSNAVAPPTIATGHLIPKPDSNEVVIGCQVARTFAATMSHGSAGCVSRLPASTPVCSKRWVRRSRRVSTSFRSSGPKSACTSSRFRTRRASAGTADATGCPDGTRRVQSRTLEVARSYHARRSSGVGAVTPAMPTATSSSSPWSERCQAADVPRGNHSSLPSA